MQMLSIEQLFEQAEMLWKDFEDLEEKNLLRLGILRDLNRNLHEKKSEALAHGKKDEAIRISELEKKIESLRNTSQFGPSFTELMASQLQGKKRTRLIPEGLYHFIPKEKLERFDRTWESTLAAEAALMGWNFWSLEVSLDVKKLNEFQNALNQTLKPNGLILFSENGDEALNSGLEAEPAEDPIWRGRWYILLKPKFRTPDFRIDSLPGANPKQDEKHVALWRILFTSRKS